MTLYRERSKSKDKHGQYKSAPAIKFMDAVRFLSAQPKFSSSIGGGSSVSAPGYHPVPPNLSAPGESGRFGDRANTSSFQSGVRPESDYADGIGEMATRAAQAATGGNVSMDRPLIVRPPELNARRKRTPSMRGHIKLPNL